MFFERIDKNEIYRKIKKNKFRIVNCICHGETGTTTERAGNGYATARRYTAVAATLSTADPEARRAVSTGS